MSRERRSGYIITSADFFAQQGVDGFGAFVRAQDAYAAARKNEAGDVVYSFEDEPNELNRPDLLPLVTLREKRNGITELIPVEDETSVMARVVEDGGGSVRIDGSVISVS